MADENTGDVNFDFNAGTVTTLPVVAPVAPITGPYSFPVERDYTGKVQFRTDRGAEVQCPDGPWRRGEVKEIKKQKYADNLVRSGNHAHVPADTEVGVPEQFRPKKSDPAAPVVPPVNE
jgi:hypothetical protein